MGPPGDGERYGGIYSQQQHPQQPAMSQRYDVLVGMYGGAGSGRNSGWNDSNRDQGETMGMYSGSMGGISSGMVGGSVGVQGQSTVPSTYSIRDDRGSNNSYMGRPGGDGRGKEGGRNGSGGSVLGTGAGTVDINKLTTLISAFQQRAQQQQQAARGAQGLAHGQQGHSQQQYADRGQRMGGPPQQGYYR